MTQQIVDESVVQVVVLCIVPRGLLKQIHSPLLITGGELITREAAAHTVSMWSCLQRHDGDCVGVFCAG